MKMFEVKVGLNKIAYEMKESRLDSFVNELIADAMLYEVKEITEHIDRRGKWYITFKAGETRYCDTELEMYKTLYYTDCPVACYGEIF